MIEVLVTLFILLVGLLGIISLQARGQQAEFESYQRTQALVLLQDMADRMNANRADAHAVTGKYAVDAATMRTVGGGGALTDCTGTIGADLDLCQWGNALKGAAETSAGGSIGAMIGARGCIAYDATTELKDSSGAILTGTGIYTISVAWQGLAPTVAPPAALACGQNSYGSESLRRVVTTPLRIAALGAL